MADPVRILLVDDDKADYVITRDMLRDISDGAYQLTWIAEPQEALAASLGDRFDLLLLDYRLGTQNGLEVLGKLRDSGATLPVIMLTAVHERRIDLEAMHAGVAEFLRKEELTPALIERAIRYALEHHRMRLQMERSRANMLAILDQLRVGTALTDETGRVTFVSSAFEQLSGAERGALLGRHWREAPPFSLVNGKSIAALLATPQEQRKKLALHWSTAAREVWAELEVQDDPRSPARKIFALYDVSDVNGLRQMLDERSRFHDIIGRGGAMQKVFRQIQELARFDSAVMIEGETGTGKELVARAIHFSSDRRDKPFVAVNCAGLTDALLASQLFGHRRGAFTGAVSDHKGYFETAQGGTIFLDELADIPQHVQTSLLRVLQEREITRLGDSVPRAIDVRILSATNQSADTLVAAGLLRMDLLYRLRVARVRLLPLRERKEDIPVLAEHFLRQFRLRTQKTVHDIDPEALRRLHAHPWPGNVRELQNAVEAAGIQCPAGTIRMEDLPAEILSPGHQDLREAPVSGRRQQREEARLREALEDAGGNRAQAARLLGISRATLYRKLAGLPDNEA